MNKSWQHRLRRLRFICIGLVCAALIAVAMLIGLVQVLLPLAAHYPDRVAQMLSSRLHQPVRFVSMDGHWQASGPLLVLHDVRIGAPSGSPLRVATADVKLDFGGVFLPGRHLVNLRLRNLRLDLKRAADGRWSVAGFGTSGGAEQKLDLGQLPGSLWLDNLRMSITDAVSGRSWRARADTLRVSNNGSTLRVAGRLRRPGGQSELNLVGRFAADGHSGRLYLGGDKLDLGQLLAGIRVRGYHLDAGQGDLQLWLDWKDSRVIKQSARLDLAGLDLSGPDGDSHIARLRGLFDFQSTAHGARIRYAGTDGAAAQVRISDEGTTRVVAARAKHLRLQPVLPLLAQVPGLPHAFAKWLLAAQPHGTLTQATLRWAAGHGVVKLNADVAGLGLRAVDHRPGIDALSGHILGDAESMLLELPAQPLTLDMPGTFRQPIVFTSLDGNLVLWHQDAGWRIGIDGLDFKGNGFAGRARGQVRVPDAGGKPFVDLFARLNDVDVRAAKQFWPIDSMSPATVKWLDSALVAGKLARADAVLRGDLADWPFHHHRGRFEAHGDIAGLTLDYNSRWPRAEGVHAVASFVNDGMLVRVDQGTSLDNRVSMAVASIPKFHDAQLLLTVEGAGSGASMLDFVRKSPIAASEAKALRRLKLGGKGDFDFSLVLPLAAAHDATLAGSARIRGMDVDNPDWGLTLDGLSGVMNFNGHGLSASALRASFNGVPSQLELALGSGATGDPDTPVRVRMQGHYSMPTLVQGRPSLTPLENLASGAADFRIEFAIHDAQAKQTQQVLSVDSDLKGMALDLPAPLDKPAATSLPLHLDLQLPVDGGDLHVALGNLAQAWARLPDDQGAPLALAVNLGDTPPTQLPSRGIRVRGHSARLDVSGWLQRALDSSGEQGNGPQLEGVDVRADSAQLFGAAFKQLHLVLQPQPQQQQILMTLDSPGVKGSLSMPTVDVKRRGIVARLDRLYWPDDTAEAEKKAVAEPGTAPVINYAATGMDPTTVPPLHISVGDLRLGKAHLGQARFESWPTPKGMHIDQLRTHTRDVQIMASGDWQGNAANSHTHMVIDFGAQNLGSLLGALGFEGLFEGGRTSAHLDASWPGQPSELALARMTGELKVQVSKGRIPEVQPGMGRLLGLMAVTELPRRLSLDFGDVFRKGFSFDSIKGSFRLADGTADTNDLTIKGPAANISITGRTNLRDKTYNQRVLVVPHVGNSLPIVGALAGGPLGAAAGLAVQGLLGHGLNKAASARYSLTGSWEKPRITLLEKHGEPRVKPPAQKPGAAPVATPATSTAAPPPSAVPAAPATVSPAPATSSPVP